MEDDDDLYEPQDSSPQDTSNESIQPAEPKEVKMEDSEDDDDDEEDIEEDDSESVCWSIYKLHRSNG